MRWRGIEGITEVREIDRRLYIRRLILCGKKQCWCASGNPNPKTGLTGHGPYWYRYFTIHAKPKTRYIGKELKPDAS